MGVLGTGGISAWAAADRSRCARAGAVEASEITQHLLPQSQLLPFGGGGFLDHSDIFGVFPVKAFDVLDHIIVVKLDGDYLLIGGFRTEKSVGFALGVYIIPRLFAKAGLRRRRAQQPDDVLLMTAACVQLLELGRDIQMPAVCYLRGAGGEAKTQKDYQ